MTNKEETYQQSTRGAGSRNDTKPSLVSDSHRLDGKFTLRSNFKTPPTLGCTKSPYLAEPAESMARELESVDIKARSVLLTSFAGRTGHPTVCLEIGS